MRVIYSKFNRERKPEFQIETSIIVHNNMFYVRKRPCHPKALKHIEKMADNYVMLKEKCKGIYLPETKMENETLFIQFVQGNSLTKRLTNHLDKGDKQQFFSELQGYIEYIYGMGYINIESFQANQNFADFFGSDIDFHNRKSLTISNLDLIFDNILMTSENWLYVIDHEWIVNFPVPVDFIIYRALINFKWHHRYYFERLLNFEEICEFCGLNRSELSLFDTMEKKFMNYVYGEPKAFQIAESYLKSRMKLEDLNKQIKELEQQVSDLSNIIVDIYQSKSWTLTAPLRKITAFVKEKTSQS